MQSCTALAMNSGPLSDRICPGTPRKMNRSESTSMTSIDFSRRDTRMARHSYDFVDDIEHAEPASIMGALLDKVVRPHVVAVLGPEPNARSVIQPETAAFRLLGRDLQPLASPDPLDPLVIDQPAGLPQQLGDLTISVAAILPDQIDDPGRQSLFVVTAPRDFALRRAMLAERRTSTALGNRQRPSYMLDAGAATRGAQ